MAELSLRAIATDDGPVYEPLPNRQWAMRANLRDMEMRSTANGQSFRVSTNSDGLRTAHERVASEGVRTIVHVGDSTTFGWGVANEHTPAALLETQLRGLIRTQSWRVVNASMPGYSSVQSWLMLREVARLYDPEIVLFQFPYHDQAPSAVPDSRAYDAHGSSGLTWTLAHRSHLYRTVRRGILRVMPPEALQGNPVTPDARSRQQAQQGAALSADQVRVPRTEFASVLDGLCTLAAKDDFRPVVFFSPNLTEIPESYLAEVQARTGEGGCLTYIDVQQHFRAQPNPGSLTIPGDPGHLNETGNLVFAASLLREMLAADVIRRGIATAQ